MVETCGPCGAHVLLCHADARGRGCQCQSSAWVGLVTLIRTHAMLEHGGGLWRLGNRSASPLHKASLPVPLLVFGARAQGKSCAGAAAVFTLGSGCKHTHTCSQVRTTAVSIYGALAAFLKLDTETWTSAKSTLDKVRLGVQACSHANMLAGCISRRLSASAVQLNTHAR